MASKSQLAADALNKTLYDLALNACMKDGRAVDRINIGAYYYSSGRVRWAIDTLPEGKGWSPARDWVNGFHHIEKVVISSDGDQEIEQEIPIWFFPQATGDTPMLGAMRKAADVVGRHVSEHPDSYPPIVINISDGEPTDGDWSEVKQAASGITDCATNDGGSLLLNIQITEHSHSPLVFPRMQSVQGCPEEVIFMAEMSSELPANMLVEARRIGMDLKEGSKGLILDADWSLLTKFLRVGTTLTTETVRDDPDPPKLLTSGTEGE